MIEVRKAAPVSAVFAAIAVWSLALAGCKSASPVAGNAPETGVAQLASQGSSGCSGEIARYRAVMKNDFDTGNVNKSVYAQFQSEIARADAACSAGRDSEAIGLVRSSKARHGYPA
ncbi:MAG: hypothetical protein JOZ16_06580 [Methylobacteriaceae bacterium]|nr:hypothetical protein [Methylobacteriaceae bacterium]